MCGFKLGGFICSNFASCESDTYLFGRYVICNIFLYKHMLNQHRTDFDYLG